jgi:hypothetical protein
MTDAVTNALDQVEIELRSELDAIREELQPLQQRAIAIEEELARVRVARSAVYARSKEPAKAGADMPKGGLAPWLYLPTSSEFRHLTMKQLVRMALDEHFPNGATANELLDHFHRDFGRTDIMRSSLSPQLSRMKSDGEIRREGLVWKLPDSAPALFEDREAFREEEPETISAEDLC